MTPGTYSHVLPGMHEEAIGRMDHLLKGSEDEKQNGDEREAK